MNRMVLHRLAVHITPVMAGLLILIGGGVCSAWLAGTPSFTRILQASSIMQFNTGMLFVLGGASLLAIHAGRHALAMAIAVVVVLFGALSLAEYLTGRDYGIDQLIMTGISDVYAIHPGRMAPNTALAFVLSGVALFLLGAARNVSVAAVAALLAVLTLALGAIAAIGYAFNLEAAYEWAGRTRMAVLTALAFIVLGLGLIRATMSISQAGDWIRLPWLAASTGIGLSVLMLLGWQALNSALRQNIGGSVMTHLPDVLLMLGLSVSALLAGTIAQARHRRLQAMHLAAANRALQASAAEIQDLYDHAPCGYHSLDREGIFIQINQTELQWLGYSRDEIVERMRVQDLLTPGSLVVFNGAFGRFKETGEVHDLELELTCRDGSILPVLLSATAVFGPDGEFLHSRSTLFDITERRRAESARRLLAAVVEHSDDAIITKTLDGTVTSWNRGAERMFGYAASEMFGQPIARLIPVELQQEEQKIVERVRHGQHVESYDTQRLRKDGELIDVSLTISPLLDTHGNVVGASKIARDVSRQKKLEKILQESERRLQALLDSLQTAVVVHGPDTAIRFVNPAAATILGLSREQLLGKAAMDPYWHFEREDGTAMPVDEYPVSMVIRARAPLRDYVVGVRFSPEQAPRWALVNAVPDLAEDRSLRQIIVSFVDISERKRLEQELERQVRVDALTGLATRRFFLDQAERELLRTRRHAQRLALLMLDVDHFKSINDRHGHPAGDAVLQRLGKVIHQSLREVDIAGRLGGEEFAILLLDADEAHALEVAERLRASVATSGTTLPDGAELRFTISIGVASTDSAEISLAELIHRSDQAMYDAKRSGRDQVRVFHD